MRTVVLSFLTAVLALCIGGCGEKRTARDAAAELHGLLAAKKFDEAYRQTAQAFRFTRSATYFEARVRELGIDEVRSVEWGEPGQQGRLSTVRGLFTLKDGNKLALQLVFTQEDGWRLMEARSEPESGKGVVEDVFAVASRTADTLNARSMEILEPIAAAMPSESQLRQMVEDTLLKFNEALRNGGDFTAFYEDASDRWKFRGRDPQELQRRDTDPMNNENRLTAAALSRAFEAAVKAGVDLSAIRGRKLILNAPPRITSDGVLNLAGNFDVSVAQTNMPGVPRKLEFSLEYVRELARWKLFGITVRVVAPGPETANVPR